MSTATTSYLDSSTTRPVPLRKRNDLVVVQHTYRHEPYWVIKDPLALEYYRFNEEEYAILDWLDGTRDLEAIRELFERKFAPHQISCRELQMFVSHLHGKSLVVHSGGGYGSGDQGRHLLELGKEKQRKLLLSRLANIYAVRSRGFDPERMLNFFNPVVSWFFSKTCVMFMSMFIVSAMLWLVMHYRDVVARLPELASFFGPDNWMMMLGLIAITKVIHELGHGFAFKRFGGECHEIGLLLLFFMPTLYCNTSDSWLLKNKWHRIAIGMAGIYMEMVMFAFAVYGWWFSHPGTFHYMCLNIMFICSVNTVLLNGNPLMRYDGYFVLADYLELPNMKERGGKTLLAWFQRHALGLPAEELDATPPKVQRILILHTISAFIYRILLLSTIAFILARRLQPIGLTSLGMIFAIVVVSTLIIRPITTVTRSLRTPGKMAQTNRKRMAITGLIVAAAAACVTLVPLPKHVVCEFTIESADGRLVYVEEPGRVHEILVQPGDHVKTGQPLLRLTNEELQKEGLELERQLATVTARVAALANVGSQTFATTAQMPQLQSEQSSLRKQLSLVNQRIDKLTICAPTDGTVFAAPAKKSESQLTDALASWQGSPLAARNRSATFNKQQPVCVIGSSDQLEAVLIIPQHEVELVANQQQVTLLLDSVTNQAMHGAITRISVAETGLDQLPELMNRPDHQKNSPQQQEMEMGIAGSLAAKVDSATGEQLVTRIFQASVPIDESLPNINISSHGTARVFVGNHTILWRFRRWMDQTMRVTF